MRQLKVKKIIFNSIIFIIIGCLATLITIYFKYYEYYKLNDSGYKNYNKTNLKGIGIYYINMKKSKDRLASIKRQLKDINFPAHRIEAIDGNNLSNQELNKNFDAKAFKINTVEVASKGVVGCYMSHVKAWKAFLESDYEYALIFEDDAKILNVKLLLEVIAELEKKPKLWDRVGFGQSNSYGGWEKYLRFNVTDLTDKVSLFQYYVPVFSMQASLINRKAATTLVQYSYPMKISAEIYADMLFGDKFSNLYVEEIVAQDNNNLQSAIEASDQIDSKIKKERLSDASFLLTEKKSALVYYIIVGLQNAFFNIKNYLAIS